MLVTNENNDTNCASAGVFIIASLAGTYDATDHVGTPPAPAQMNRLATFSVGRQGRPVPSARPRDRPGPIGDCSAHWFTVRGNIVALGNYEQGLRFIDVSDPATPGRWAGPASRCGRSAAAAGDHLQRHRGAYWHGATSTWPTTSAGSTSSSSTTPSPGTIQSKVCWNSCADYQTAWKDEFGGAGGTVGATLSLSMGTAAGFGPFAPGVAHDYTATGTASVISTAGDATLSVADPSSSSTGHLVNGTFSLPAALQIKGSSAAGTGAASFADVGGSAAPTQVLTYSGPTSNDAVTMTFQQHIGSTDALRTGTYSKSLTFTLSTTNP